MGRIVLSAILLLLCAAPPCPGNDIGFRRISVMQGLSQSTVFDIAQDTRGYYWVGTADGLNRYDGYEFVVYRHIPDDSTSLAGNTVHSILPDRQNTMWVGTATGLSRYNPRTNDFTGFPFRGENLQVFDIEQAGEDKLLLATDTGILLFDITSGTFTVKAQAGRADNRLLAPFGENILVGRASGLALYDVALGIVSPVAPELAGMDITDVVHIPGQGCWIATFGGGIFRTDESLHVLRHYTHGDPGALRTDYVRVLRLDSQGRLWAGTFDGLYILDTRSGTVEEYTYAANDESSLGQNSIRSIYIDHSGGVWLGSFYGGLNYYHPLLTRFGSIRHREGHNSLSDNTVSCIVEQAATGNLWIGTNDGGVNYYEPSTGRFTHYTASAGGLHSNNIKCVLDDGRNGLYIGTHAGGLSRMDTRTRRIETYAVNTSVPVMNSCYSLLDAGDGQLWAGTLNGLMVFDTRRKTFSPHPWVQKAPRLGALEINSLLRDSRGRVWICTNRGLYLCGPDGQTITPYETMPIAGGGHITNANILSVHEDSRGNVWLGSDQGLFRYMADQGVFSVYTTREGLPNDYVYGILEDGQGRLWISTNVGLSCFDPLGNTIRNYAQMDGIHNLQFNRYSYCKTSSGLMYFGGIDGITYFDPAALADNPYSPPAIITGVTVFNRNAALDPKVEITREQDGTYRRVRFPSRYNVFGIRFVAINPVAAGNNEFSYTLRGFDSEWYRTSNREVNYSNLPPGKYVFHLRSCNNDGVWAEGETTFTVHITPMWYQTALARIIYALVILALAFLVVRFYLERLDKRRIEEVGQEKVRFYVNLSHELRTPLTLILSPLDELRAYRPEDKYLSSRVGLIRRNSGRMLHMVNQLLDYSKAESGIMKVRPAEQNPEQIVSDIFVMFEEIAYSRDIDYMLDLQTGSARYPLDRNFVERILMNLLSNAFKFTPDGGVIKVSLTGRDGRLVLTVANSGEGIAPEEQQRIFERFYKADEGRLGTGVGLSIVKRLAELHHGTVGLHSEDGRTEFTVSFPATPAAYAPGEIGDHAARGLDAAAREFYVEDSTPHDGEIAGNGTQDERRETLMIVEDNPEIKKYLSASFREKYNIVTASEGQQALAMIKESNPDIVITDLMMPGMDGLALVRSIKQNIQTCHIPVIILTAKDSPEEQIRGMEAGADDYLTKPFSIPMLSAKVGNLIKARYRLLNHYSSAVEVDPGQITHNPMDGEFLRKAVQAVEDNLSNVGFSTDLFAEAMHMSRSGLHIKMKSLTGESTINFIRKIRLGHACRLLEQGERNITEISEMTGFSSSSYFATTFKKHLGTLPTEYARSKKNRPVGTPADKD